jgi:predicted metal-binding membrane protein
MDKTQKAVAASLIATSALAWIASINQPDMMVAMTTYNPLSISVFTASWTAGMAAMMFPAITPMVLMYNRFTAQSPFKKKRKVRQHHHQHHFPRLGQFSLWAHIC